MNWGGVVRASQSGKIRVPHARRLRVGFLTFLPRAPRAACLESVNGTGLRRGTAFLWALHSYFFDSGSAEECMPRSCLQTFIFCSRSRKYAFQLSGNAATRKARRTDVTSSFPYLFAI